MSLFQQHKAAKSESKPTSWCRYRGVFSESSRHVDTIRPEANLGTAKT